MVYYENPYDLESILEGLRIASKQGKELIFVDRLIATLRFDPYADIVNINYNTLKDLQLLEIQNGKLKNAK